MHLISAGPSASWHRNPPSHWRVHWDPLQSPQLLESSAPLEMCRMASQTRWLQARRHDAVAGVPPAHCWPGNNAVGPARQLYTIQPSRSQNTCIRYKPSGQATTRLGRSGEIRGDQGRSGEIRGDLGKSGEIGGDQGSSPICGHCNLAVVKAWDEPVACSLVPEDSLQDLQPLLLTWQRHGKPAQHHNEHCEAARHAGKACRLGGSPPG